MVKKLEWIEMEQLATIPVSCGERKGKKEKRATLLGATGLPAELLLAGGTTRSRVNFFMNKFRKLGFVHCNGGLQVHSSLLNVVLHD